MLNMLRGEWYKIRKSAVTKVITIVLLAYTALNSGIYMYLNLSDSPTIQEMTGGKKIKGIDAIQSTFSGDTGLLLLAIFLTILIANEFTTGSIRQIVSHGFSKKKIVLAKYIIGCSFFSFIYLLAALINFVCVSATGGVGDFGGDKLGRVLLMLLGQVLVVFGYGALAAFVTWLFKAGGISVAINIIILFAGGVGFQLLYMATKKEFFANYWITCMSSDLADITVKMSRVWTDMGIFAVLAAIFTIASVVLFNKRDVD